MTDLDKLIEAVEGGTATAPQIHDALGRNALHAISAFNGSLDAAKALHDALVPNLIAKITVGGVGCKYHHCTLEDWDSGEDTHADNQPDPARAWLIAILRAYREETEK